MESAYDWAQEKFGVESDWVRQIQLDAMREGMRRAAKLVSVTPATNDRIESRAWYVKTVLSAAEQLTEKDLG